jgi:hypothetical protein
VVALFGSLHTGFCAFDWSVQSMLRLLSVELPLLLGVDVAPEFVVVSEPDVEPESARRIVPLVVSSLLPL